MSIPDLQPYSMKLGIYPRFFTSRQVSLVVEENALSPSGREFIITNSEGANLFLVTGHKARFSSYRTHVRDTRRNVLFAIVKKSLSSGFYAEGPDGKNILDIKSRLRSSPLAVLTLPANSFGNRRSF